MKKKVLALFELLGATIIYDGWNKPNGFINVDLPTHDDKGSTIRASINKTQSMKKIQKEIATAYMDRGARNLQKEFQTLMGISQR